MNEHSQQISTIRQVLYDFKTVSLTERNAALAALEEISVREGRIDQVIASLQSLRNAMEAEYDAGKESLFRTWSLQVGCAIISLSTPTVRMTK